MQRRKEGNLRNSTANRRCVNGQFSLPQAVIYNSIGPPIRRSPGIPLVTVKATREKWFKGDSKRDTRANIENKFLLYFCLCDNLDKFLRYMRVYIVKMYVYKEMEMIKWNHTTTYYGTSESDLMEMIKCAPNECRVDIFRIQYCSHFII